MAGPGFLRFRNEPLGAKFANRTPGGNVATGRTGSVAVRFYIKGGPELVRKLGQLGKAMSDEALVQATLAGATVLADKWREVAPYYEGYLKRAITANASPGKKGATGIVYVANVPGVPANEQPVLYAGRLEFGSLRQTRKMLKRGQPADPGRYRRPRPSLRPAFDASYQQMIDAVADEIRDIIHQVAP